MLRSIVLVLVAVAVLAANAAASPVLDDILNYAVVDQQATDGGGTVEVTPSKPVGQTFVTGPDVSELCGITVQIDQSAEKWSEGEEVTLTVWSSPSKKKKLASWTLDSADVKNRLGCDPFYIRCKARPKTSYYFEITHNGKGDGKAEVRVSGSDSYANGSAYIARKQQKNDLWFRVIVRNKANDEKLMERFAAGSIAPEDSGYYLMCASQSAEPYDNARYMVLHNGDWYGAHGRRDRLPPALYAYGRPLLVDPGRSDDSKERDGLRPSTADNPITLDGRDYDTNHYGPEGAAHTNWSTQQSMDFFDGRCRPYDNTYLDRQILFVKPWYWVVTDQVRMDEKESHKTEQTWHFAPSEITVDPATDLISTSFPTGGNLQLIPLATKDLEVKQEKAWVSSEGGKKEEAPVALLEREGETPIHYATILRPFKGPAPNGKFSVRLIMPIRSADGDFTALAVTTDFVTDYISISHNADGSPTSVDSKELTYRAKALRVAMTPQGLPAAIAWVDGSEAVIEGRKLASSSKPIKELDVRNDGVKVVINSSEAEPSLEIYLGGASQAVVNGNDVISLEPGQKYLKPFAEHP